MLHPHYDPTFEACMLGLYDSTLNNQRLAKNNTCPTFRKSNDLDLK